MFLIHPGALTPRSESGIVQSRSDSMPILQHNPYGVPENFKEFCRLLRVRSGTEFIPFDLFDWQVELSNLIDQCQGIAIWKTRQTGASEVIEAKMLHRSLLSAAYLGVTFSLGQAESSKLSDRVGLMPAGISGVAWSTDSKTARKSERGGELLFRPSTPNSARSLASVTDLFFDECGFPADIAEMYANATPSQNMVGSAARRILATTIPPEGLQCWFGQTFWQNLEFDLVEEMERVREGRGRQDNGLSYWIDEFGWARMLLHWRSHPIYASIPNYLQKIKERDKLTQDQLDREHDLGLPKDGASLFVSTKIAECATGLWAEPIPKHFYLMCCDPNFGSIGNDYHTIQVWDITSPRISLVHELRDNEHGSEWHRQQFNAIARKYKPVIAVFEDNGGGKPMAEKAVIDCPWLRVETVTSGRISKIANTDRIALMIEQGGCEYPDNWQGMGEMRNFSARTRQALSGHDDTITCWAAGMAWLEVSLSLRVNGTGIEGGSLEDGLEDDWGEFFDGF